jgi:branched-chain amino acid transport system permease protein
VSTRATARTHSGVRQRLTVRSVLLWLLLVLLLLSVPLVDRNIAQVSAAADAGVFVLLALGLNIVVGYAGLLDLGYAAFFAIGAYVFGLTASAQFNLHFNFWLMLPVAAIVAAMFGATLGFPTLRLRGDYIAIVTLGFGEIVPTVILNLPNITNGPNGLTAVDRPNLPGLSFGLNPIPYYYLILLIIGGCVWMNNNLRDSRLGRAWMAVREDEIAASAMGINTTIVKLLAYALGASFSGFAGVFYASKLGSVSPDNFQFVVSVQILSMVVLGGLASIRGVIVGAVVLYLLQGFFLNQLTIWSHALGNSIHVGFLTVVDFNSLKYGLYGVALVAMMRFRPEGLIPSSTRKAELKRGVVEASVFGVDGEPA